MPELPEVETIKRGLIDKIVNKKIKDIWIEPSFKKKISPSARNFLGFLKGKQFRDVHRKAKLLIIEVNADNFVLVHLKMTGQLVYKPKNGKLVAGGHPIDNISDLPNKFTRVSFSFSDGSRLFFNDVRKFGYLKLASKFELEKAKDRFGVEPFEKEYTIEFFEEVLKRRPNRKIKDLLLDQQLIAGLGNIYVDETCFVSKVKPQRLVKSLTKAEKQRLFDNAKAVMQKAIKHKGTSFSNYVNSEGNTGNFQKYLQVYGRVGKPCLLCKTELKKIKIAGRTSSYCPKCQK
jgi:formamidopyrimidine-DNA glycosylase